MKLWMRVVAMVVLTTTLGVPLGIAAEGYVCASGARMDGAAMRACVNCASRGHALDASARRALEHRSIGRACCTYVNSNAPPEAVSAGTASLDDFAACARAAHAPVVAACPAAADGRAPASPPPLADAWPSDPGGAASPVTSYPTDNLRL